MVSYLSILLTIIIQERDAAVEITMLRNNEISIQRARQLEWEKQQEALRMKHEIQNQMIDREKLRDEAQQEYIKEREQVDAIINKMIQEDHEMMRITKMKQE